MKTLGNIRSQFNAIDRALFRIDGNLDYDEVTDAIINLANAILDTDTDENIWYIGEFGECTLDDLIVGAFWHYTEWHNGQWSKEYEALSALGQIYTPNMETVDPENPAYQALADMVE